MKTVLVVDDDRLIRQSLVQALKDAGLQTVEAGGGQEGLDKALEARPDLILADVRMPGMDGLQMIEELRTDDWGKQVPVVILSTDETTESVNQALSAGVTVYLSKTQLTPDAIAQQIVNSLK